MWILHKIVLNLQSETEQEKKGIEKKKKNCKYRKYPQPKNRIEVN